MTYRTPDSAVELVTLEPEDCALLAREIQRLADRARVDELRSPADVVRLGQLAAAVSRVALATVGGDRGRLADAGWLSVREVSKLLGVSERTARRRCRAAGAVMVGGVLRVARDDLEATKHGT
jgi:hypothetical protein